MSRFNVQNDFVAMMAHVDNNNNNNNGGNKQEDGKATNTRMDDDLMFANDSQEEQFMLQQALQQSLAYDDSAYTQNTHTEDRKTVTNHDHQPGTSKQPSTVTSTVKTGNNRGSHTQSSNDKGSNTVSYYEHQPQLHQIDFPREVRDSTRINGATSSSTPLRDVQVKTEMTEDEYELNSILQFKLYDEIQSTLQDNQSDYYNESQDDELQKALDLSRIQNEGKKNDLLIMNRHQVNERTRNEGHAEDDQLQKALHESRQEYISPHSIIEGDKTLKLGKAQNKHKMETSVKDDKQLEKALQESKQHYIKQNKECRDNNDKKDLKVGSEDDELQKALLESRKDYEIQQQTRKAEVNQKNKGESDEDLEKALQESRKQYERQQRIAKFEASLCPRKDNHATKHSSNGKMNTSLLKSQLSCESQRNLTRAEAMFPDAPSSENHSKDKSGSLVHETTNFDTLAPQAMIDDDMQETRESPDDEMEKALQDSKLEYEMQKTKEKMQNEEYDEEAALHQALELSRMEMEAEKTKVKEKNGIGFDTLGKDLSNDNSFQLTEQMGVKEIDSHEKSIETKITNTLIDNNCNIKDHIKYYKKDFVEETQDENNVELYHEIEIPDFARDANSDELSSVTPAVVTNRSVSCSVASLTSPNSGTKGDRPLLSKNCSTTSRKKPAVRADEDVLSALARNLNQDDSNTNTKDYTSVIIDSPHGGDVSTGNFLVDEIASTDNGSTANVNPSYHDDNGNLIDSCHGDDAIFIDSQESHDNDLFEDNDVTIQKDNASSSYEKLKSLGIKKNHATADFRDNNQVIDSCHGDDAILIDSQDLDDSNVVNTEDITFASQTLEGNQEQTMPQTSGRQKSHKESTGSLVTGLSFRQKAEAIARGKVSMMSLSRSNKTCNSRQRPDKRGSDGKLKNNYKTSSPTRSPSASSSSSSNSTSSPYIYSSSSSSLNGNNDVLPSKKPRKDSQSSVFTSGRPSQNSVSSNSTSSSVFRKSSESFPNSLASHISSTSSRTLSKSSTNSAYISRSSSEVLTSSKSQATGKTGKTCHANLFFPSSSPSPKPAQTNNVSSHDDIIMIDSQDDNQEAVDSTTDFEIAWQLQEELNNEAKEHRDKNFASSTNTQDSRNYHETGSNSGSFVFPRSSPTLSSNGKRDSCLGFTFPLSSQSTPSSSRSSSSDTPHGFTFPSSSLSPRSPLKGTANLPQPSSEWSKHSKGTSGPKCSDCNEYGHRKGAKKCPYYYTEEAQRKREEQAQKRKEKREEEDRKQQEKVDALVAQHTQMAEEAEQIRRQIERFNRRNNNLPKMVEDVSKLLKKRRRK